MSTSAPSWRVRLGPTFLSSGVESQRRADPLVWSDRGPTDQQRLPAGGRPGQCLGVVGALQSAGDEDSRGTKRHDNVSSPDFASPAMAEKRRRAAIRPSCCRFMSMVVSGGRDSVASTSQLSKPTTETCEGTESPSE